VGTPPAGSAGSGVRVSAHATSESIPKPSAETVQQLRELISSSSMPRPLGDFGYHGRCFSDADWKSLEVHGSDLVKEYTQAGKRRRKMEAKARKEKSQWLADAQDRMSLLVAQPKARPKS